MQNDLTIEQLKEVFNEYKASAEKLLELETKLSSNWRKIAQAVEKENISLRKENTSLRKENTSLRKELEQLKHVEPRCKRCGKYKVDHQGTHYGCYGPFDKRTFH